MYINVVNILTNKLAKLDNYNKNKNNILTYNIKIYYWKKNKADQ